MKIRMLVSVAGDGFALSPGEVTERFGDEDAARLVQADYAVVIASDTALAALAPSETLGLGVIETAVLPPVETAVAGPVETAVLPPAETRAEDNEKSALVAEAEALGIDVDGRWSVRRLKLEIAAAKTAPSEPEAPAPEAAG